MILMKILIDGDACNTIEITENIAINHNIQTHIYCDTKHIIDSLRSVVHIISHGDDTVDFAIIKDCEENDIIITNDSGLAAMGLVKRCKIISPNGFEYTEHNINKCLENRYLRKHTARKTNKKQVKGIPSRNIKYSDFGSLLEKIIKKQERKL